MIKSPEGRVVGQFAVAALYERRNLMNQKAAVIDRRYKSPGQRPGLSADSDQCLRPERARQSKSIPQ